MQQFCLAGRRDATKWRACSGGRTQRDRKYWTAQRSKNLRGHEMPETRQPLFNFENVRAAALGIARDHSRLLYGMSQSLAGGQSLSVYRVRDGSRVVSIFIERS